MVLAWEEGLSRHSESTITDAWENFVCDEKLVVPTSTATDDLVASRHKRFSGVGHNRIRLTERLVMDVANRSLNQLLAISPLCELKTGRRSMRAALDILYHRDVPRQRFGIGKNKAKFLEEASSSEGGRTHTVVACVRCHRLAIKP